MDSGKFLDQFKDQVQQQDAQQNAPQQGYDQYYGQQQDYSQYYGQYYGAYPGYDAYGQDQQAYQDPNVPYNIPPPTGYGYTGLPPPNFAVPPPPSHIAAMQKQQSHEKNPPRPGGAGEPSRSIWVGNVHPDTTDAELHALFAPFGIIENIKLLPVKNCAFIRFYELDAAIAAHTQMHGHNVHGQQLKVGWGKPEPESRDNGPPPCRNLWIGNIGSEVSEERLRDLFGRFGTIEKVRMLPQKGCAFVNFMSMDAAVTARSQMNGMIVGDKPMKINFGKDNQAEEREKKGLDFHTPIVAPKENEPPPQFDPPPPDYPPPNDPALRTVIEKMAEYVAKNGRTFELVTIEKNKDNPKFGFLKEDNPLNGYYKLRLWCSEHPAISPAEYRQRMDEYNRALQQKEMYSAVPPPMENEWQQQPPPPQYGAVAPPSYNAMPPPPMDNNNDDIAELITLLDNLVPTKDSIKTVKNWIVQRPLTARDIASFLKARAERAKDFDTKLNLVYLIHDVLHHTLRDRAPGETSDAFSSAFQYHLGPLLRSAYQGQPPENQEKIIKVMRMWGEKGIYSPEVVQQIDAELKRQVVDYHDSRRDYGDRGYSRDRDYSRDNRDNNNRDNRDYRDHGRDRRDDRGRDNRDRRGRDDDYDSKKRGRDRDYDSYDSKRRH